MKKALLIAAVFFAALGMAYPPAADARVFVSARFGCCGGYYPYYGYPAYYYPYAVEPPPVVYTVPQAPVVYAQPQPQVVVQQPAPAPIATAPSAAPQSSTTFVDSQGRTCRHYEGAAPGSLNTACLQPDGSWRTVQ